MLLDVCVCVCVCVFVLCVCECVCLCCQDLSRSLHRMFSHCDSAPGRTLPSFYQARFGFTSVFVLSLLVWEIMRDDKRQANGMPVCEWSRVSEKQPRATHVTICSIKRIVSCRLPPLTVWEIYPDQTQQAFFQLSTTTSNLALVLK